MAMARKVRDRKFPQTDFEIDIPTAVSLLIRANQIEPTDQWAFTVRDQTLVVTRIRPTINETIVDP